MDIIISRYYYYYYYYHRAVFFFFFQKHNRYRNGPRKRVCHYNIIVQSSGRVRNKSPVIYVRNRTEPTIRMRFTHSFIYKTKSRNRNFFNDNSYDVTLDFKNSVKTNKKRLIFLLHAPHFRRVSQTAPRQFSTHLIFPSHRLPPPN